jgi:hypothetical protein
VVIGWFARRAVTSLRSFSFRALEGMLALLFGMAAVAKMDSMAPFSDEVATLLRVAPATAGLAAVAACALELYLAAGLLFAPGAQRGRILVAIGVVLAGYSALLIVRGEPGGCLCYGLGRAGTLAALLDQHPLTRNSVMLLACGACLLDRRSRLRAEPPPQAA